MAGEIEQSLPEWLERSLGLWRKRARAKIEEYASAYAEAYQDAVRTHAGKLTEAMGAGRFTTDRDWHPLHFGEAGTDAVARLLPPTFRKPRWSFALRDLSDLIAVDTSGQLHFRAVDASPLRARDQDIDRHALRWEREWRQRVRLTRSILLALGSVVVLLGAVVALLGLFQACD